MSQTALDTRWMQLALSLGARSQGQTWPNPSVGCVIVKDHRVVGRGFTQPTGRPHSEVVALAQAGGNSIGSTAYVTLEPCAHTGETPPCASALINAKVSRVVVATRDPDPRVSGKGIAMLEQAGIKVVEGICKAEADQTHAGFFKRITKSRPFITLKLATSVDGKIATKTGDSQWITSAPARAYVHYLRATHDAVMVGRGTSIEDDPSLTVRTMGSDIHQPVRIVLDTNLASNPKGILGASAPNPPVWMCHANTANIKAWGKTRAELLECKSKDKTLDLNDVMAVLAQRGLTRVFCEGGGTLAAGLLKANLVDRLVTMQAGVAIGGDGLNALAELGTTKLADANRFNLVESRPIGPDVLTVWEKS